MAPFATSHEGVSCDGCMMPNFSGSRYKCLRCWDFDLCHACYVAERFQQDPNGDQVHERDHPMQCILTHHDFEMMYADDDSRNYSSCRIAVLTCPYCDEHGFSDVAFYEHVVRNHPDPPEYQVNCPLCIGLVEADTTNRVVDNLKQHWTSVHYQFDPTIQATIAAGEAATAHLHPPPHVRAARAEAAAGMVPPTGGPLDLPPTRFERGNGARRPMMARRAGRQTGADRTDRENREAPRGERQAAAAAAAFGMPWTEADDVQDLFRAYRLVQRNAALPIVRPEEGARAPGAERGRLNRLRNPGAATGNMVTNAEFIQRMLGVDPNATAASYASLVRNLNRDASDGGAGGEYAAPRPHGATRSRTPPAPVRRRADMFNVVIGLGSRSMQATQFDNFRQEDIELDRTPSLASPFNSSNSELSDSDDDDDEDDVDEEAAAAVAAAAADTAAEQQPDAPTERSPAFGSADAPVEESSEDEDETEEPKANQDYEVTSEDERVEALSKQAAIAETSLTQEEVVDLRRCEDPFAVRIVDPIKAIRANATSREWKVIKRMLKNNDLRAKDETLWTSINEDGRWHKMDEDVGDSEDEIWVDNLRNGRPPGPVDEEDYGNNWLTVRTDTSSLSFARDSYWKDKRFIRPRKLERQQSIATVDQGDLARNALTALSISRCMAGGKVLSDTTGLTQGEEMRKTLEMWDMRKTEYVDPKSELDRKVEQVLADVSRNTDFDYDTALLAIYRSEMKEVQDELTKRSAEGSPSSAVASKHVDQLKQYLSSLHAAGGAGSVLPDNPRADPSDQQELEERLMQQVNEEMLRLGLQPEADPNQAPNQPSGEQPGPSHA